MYFNIITTKGTDFKFFFYFGNIMYAKCYSPHYSIIFISPFLYAFHIIEPNNSPLWDG